MTEMTIGTLASASLIGLAISTFFYMWGGREGKWKRRFIASLILSTTVCVVSFLMDKFVWQLLGIYPLLILGFSQGYGVNDGNIAKKILRRTIYALMNVLSGLLFCFFVSSAGWLIFIPHVGIAAWSIYMGTKNSIAAAAEEVFICALLNLGLCMYPFMV